MTSLDARIAQGGLAAAAAIATFLSWQYGYEGSARAYRRDAVKAAALQETVSQLETMVQTAGGPVAWLVKTQQRISQMKDRFPGQAQLPEMINRLVDTVKAGAIQLTDVSQGNLEPAVTGGQPVIVDGRSCVHLPVTLTMEGRYHDLIAAVSRLTEPPFPGLVSIEQVELRRKDAESPVLVATVQVHLYLLAGAPAVAPDA